MAIATCTCTRDPKGNDQGAKFQDARYGKGQRLHNETADGGSRCTVCGTKKGGGGKK